MRTYRNSVLTYGLVNVPVQVCAAKEDGDFKPTMVGPNDEEIRQVYVDNEDVIIEYDDTKRAIDVLNGRAIVTKAQIKAIDDAIAEELGKGIEITEFRPLSSIPFEARANGSSYYLQSPVKNGNHRSFKTLCAALKKEKKAGIAKWIPHTREQLIAIWVESHPEGDVLRATALTFTAECREPDEECFAHNEAEVRPKELQMARTLIQSMESQEVMEGEADQAIARRRELFETTAQGQDLPKPKAASKKGAEELMEALTASVDEIQGKRKSKAAA